jgi:hypothetical protein
MLGDPDLKTLRLSPWRLNFHTKWGREGNGMWGQGPAQRKQIKKKKYIHNCGSGFIETRSGSSISSESGSWYGYNWIQGFDDQKLKEKSTDLIKNCNLLMSKLQEKPSALHLQHFKRMKFNNFFIYLWVIFALLAPDPDPIESRSGSTALAETNWDRQDGLVVRTRTWKNSFPPRRGLQRDIVYLGWPIAPS